MATCYDCIHCDACNDAGDSGFSCLKEDVSKCKHFKNKADFVEVKHGEWVEKEEVYGDVYYTCSNCNNDWTTIDGTPQENFMKYCPNCGAKMDGERK